MGPETSEEKELKLYDEDEVEGLFDDFKMSQQIAIAKILIEKYHEALGRAEPFWMEDSMTNTEKRTQSETLTRLKYEIDGIKELSIILGHTQVYDEEWVAEMLDQDD